LRLATVFGFKCVASACNRILLLLHSRAFLNLKTANANHQSPPCIFASQEERNLQQKNRTQQELEVIAIGEPDIESLPEGERAVFYTTLLKRLEELALGGK